jgi:hypothetical protein
MHSSLVIPGSFLVTILTNASAMFLILGETFGRPIFPGCSDFDFNFRWELGGYVEVYPSGIRLVRKILFAGIEPKPDNLAK